MKRSRRTVRPRRLAGQQLASCVGAILALAVAAAPAQECAYVGNQLVGTVRILTIPDGDEISSTVLPGCSAGGVCQLTDIAVVAESTTVYVSQFDGNRLWVLAAADPNTPSEPMTIPLPSAPTNMVLAPGHSRL